MKKHCSSCNNEVTDNYVEFDCPDCGKKIARCKQCRDRSSQYKCSCGFTGP